MKKFIFFYLMNNDNEKIKITASEHSRYWKDKNLSNFQGGPFSDFSGGCITFSTNEFEDAKDFVLNDPFLVSNCLDVYWIKEWMLDIR